MIKIPLDQYIGTGPLSRPLPDREVRRLIGLAQAGDDDARNRIIEVNLRWVIRVAGKIASDVPCCEFDDLVQTGVFGLVRAIEKFDLGRPVKFLTYASHWIFQIISRHYSDHRYVVRVPYYIQGRHRRGQPVNERLAAMITANEHRHTLADAPEDSLADGRGDIERFLDADQDAIDRARLTEAIQQLPPDLRRVLVGRANGATFRELGEELKITRQAIQQREGRALQAVAKSFGLAEPAHPTLKTTGRVRRRRQQPAHGQV